MSNTQHPKSFYRVYECTDVNDAFSYDEDRWYYQNDNLAMAHTYAYDMWKNNPGTSWTIIQPYDGSCRGGYGAWVDNNG